ncbi:hypothetical protein J2S11_002434 [Bacillus horti]|uniref:Uncharacterized protein n=1 Tax=Caldalkalibacillus horti TaxID=77523 RepID=A0ABT9W113_9BACI|nr:hypothetical protein [Bacillus horti]
MPQSWNQTIEGKREEHLGLYWIYPRTTELGGYYTELLKCCDVLVDGPFILSERDLSLTFKGSRNQRNIQLNKVKELA